MKKSDIKLGVFCWHRNERSVFEVVGSGSILMYREWFVRNNKVNGNVMQGSCRDYSFVAKTGRLLTQEEINNLKIVKISKKATQDEEQNSQQMSNIMKKIILDNLSTDEVRQLAIQHGLL